MAFKRPVENAVAYTLLDKEVRGLEVQPEGQIWCGRSLGSFFGKWEPGKWITIALLGEVSQSLGAARLAGTMHDNLGGTCSAPWQAFPRSLAWMDLATWCDNLGMDLAWMTLALVWK